MGNQVYANNMEVSCKAAMGKAICAFPDVCFTPPTTPATPPGVPIPYPNTGMASDTTSGSSTVKISDQEVMLKNKSHFKQSYGDEAGCAPKKGFVTTVNRGKVYFTMWSMDVKVEGENVVRNLDLTTHNHGSVPGNTSVWPYIDEAAFPGIDELCSTDREREEKACENCKPYGDKDPCPPYNPPKPPPPPEELAKLRGIRKKNRTATQQASIASLSKTYKSTPEYEQWVADRKSYFEELAKATQEGEESECLKARRCMLVPFQPRGRGKKRQPGCCPGQTPHHLIEASAFLEPGSRKKGGTLRPEYREKESKYDLNKAPCICAEGPDNTTATHGLMHTYQGMRAQQIAKDDKWTVNQACETASASVNMVFKSEDGGCSPDCLEAQLKAYHCQQEVGLKPEDKIEASPSGKLDDENVAKAWADHDAKMKANASGVPGVSRR